ncbi:MAG TPA: alpha/beta hydrolase [Vicinamibacterales bacterium]|nr:alpha/beta hydrolase [Vicinamibacterales bacterium]
MLSSPQLNCRPQVPPSLLRLLPLLTLLTLAGTAACVAAPGARALDRLHPCASAEGPTDAYCGTFSVFENRDTRTGRRIDLWIVLLPAVRPGASDPLFFLAGGPGQSAAQLARQIRDAFRNVQRTRDIVLVDQRGTGKSNPLNCRSDASSLRELTDPVESGLDRLKHCLDGYNADVRLYTTTIAMDDLDDVRAHLGYEQVNLYGGSYGTRAALVYLRRHGTRVRSVILDGVAPTDMRLPLFTARDAQRALDKLLTDCDADKACHQAFPELATRIRGLLQRLEREPARVRVVHPRTGIAEDVRVEARVVASILFSALYSPLTASVVPALVDQAERNEFQGLFALALAGDSADENMSVGMQLSVLCSEDAARVTPHDVQQATAGTVFGSHLLGNQLKACDLWPRGTVDRSYYEPVVSDVPVLVLSGDLDPVTPPNWGEAVVKSLSHGRHITVPGTGHGVISTSCGVKLIEDFLDRASAATLDTSCVPVVRRPPFFVTPAGPDPAHTGLAQ